MKKIIDWKILDFLKENNGNLSSTRLFALAIITSAIIEWQHAIWTLGGIWKPDYMTIGLVCGIMGLKVLQKSTEQKLPLDSLTSTVETDTTVVDSVVQSSVKTVEEVKKVEEDKIQTDTTVG